MPTLTLRQIEPPYPGASLRTLVLQGWAGPIDEMTVGGSQRAQLEWMPWSYTARVRLDGPEEDEIGLSFAWRTRQIAGTNAAQLVVTGSSGQPDSDSYAKAVESLIDFCHAMRRETALVAMEWNGNDYVGYISRFSATQGRVSEYTADMSFQPIKAPNSPFYLGTVRPDVERTAEDLAAQFDEGIDAGRTEQLPTFRAKEVNLVDESVEQVRDALGEVQAQAGTIQNAARSVEAVQKGVAFAIGGALTAGQVLVESLLAPGEQIAQTDEYAAQIKGRVYRSTIRQTSTRMRRNAADARRGLITTGDGLGIHHAVEGETLWSISWRWYGTTRFASLIAERNGLTSPFVNAGQRLIIPKRPGHG